MPDITREQLAGALEGFYVQVCVSPERVGSYEIADPDETADTILATLGRMAALREPQDGPDYYDGKGGMQPFDVIDAFSLDFYEGNVIKYLVRWRKKNGIEDLRKARTYLARIISRAEQTDG